LTGLGFSEREAKVYLVLLARRSATSADLQREAGIPQTKIYEIIRRLVSQGYCRERRTESRHTFEVVDPTGALNPAIRSLKASLREAQDLSQDLCAIQAQAGQSLEPLDYIHILRGDGKVHQCYCDLTREARREILGFGRPPYACNTPERVLEQTAAMQDFLARGGLSRWVYELDPDNRPWLMQVFIQLRQMGVMPRLAVCLPLKMIIFDSRKVFLQQGEEADLKTMSAAVLSESTVAAAYQSLFEFFWNQGQEFDSESILLEKPEPSQAD
jgi:DNA-binding MarR family transcriptional regulator